ncbi:MAG: hypothetical protein F6K62_21220 [Sphaerospermopsis sp. SIO1G2]|nr:hypothetical protein [Sphaerospermopsis sp. SIO1G2]
MAIAKNVFHLFGSERKNLMTLKMNLANSVFDELLAGLPLRPPEEVMQPERIGAVWPTRLSFAQILLDRLIEQRWQIEISENHLDGDGIGELIYRIKSPTQTFYFVVFSQKLSPEERTDRVIADGWDAAAALCEGELTAERLADLRRNVPRQEYGRADTQTLVWTRGNRSGRFFDYVVDCLAEGEQPDPERLAQGGYIFRSTAYYGNTKFGLKSYRSIDKEHDLHGSFLPQMLAAFLFREFAADLAEHIAEQRSGRAVKIALETRRYLGIGNATGMGLVPFVINHPHLVHAWSMVREIPLARAKQLTLTAADPAVARLHELVSHLHTYFAHDSLDVTHVFAHREKLLAEVEQLLGWLGEFQADGRLLGEVAARPWARLCALASENLSVESQELLHTLLIELYPEHSAGLSRYLDAPRPYRFDVTQTVGELCQLIERCYAWVLADPPEQAEADQLFWYFSADSEEPLIGERGEDDGEWSARPVDIALQVWRLYQDLRGIDSSETIGYFLLVNPHHRAIIARVQSLQDLMYAEIRTNLHHKDVIPLHTQRFQLAQYGMNRFNPQSIYWLRVTLLQGAPIAQDVAHGRAPSRMFFPLPPKLANPAKLEQTT